jgi:cell division protein FtsB
MIIKNRHWLRELSILSITLLALYHAGRSILGSMERQAFLHSQSIALRDSQRQNEEINKELREGLSNYRTSNGIERLARERLGLAGQDEIIVRIGK